MKRKRTDRQHAVMAADKALRLLTLAETPYCVLCGTSQRLQAGHLITRTKFSVRWSRDNVFTQCAGCNLRHEHQPEIFTTWYIQKFGVQKYENLVGTSNRIVKYTTGQIWWIAEAFTDELRKVEAKHG